MLCYIFMESENKGHKNNLGKENENENKKTQAILSCVAFMCI